MICFSRVEETAKCKGSLPSVIQRVCFEFFQVCMKYHKKILEPEFGWRRGNRKMVPLYIKSDVFKLNMDSKVDLWPAYLKKELNFFLVPAGDVSLFGLIHFLCGSIIAMCFWLTTIGRSKKNRKLWLNKSHLHVVLTVIQLIYWELSRLGLSGSEYFAEKFLTSAKPIIYRSVMEHPKFHGEKKSGSSTQIPWNLWMFSLLKVSCMLAI